MIYATTDADEHKISANATIRAFETEEDARAYLLGAFDASDWRLDTAVIGAGDYGDCWVKVHSEPEVEGDKLVAGLFDGAPFCADQLIVRKPGQHPGSRAWWIEPSEEVLVVTFVESARTEGLDP